MKPSGAYELIKGPAMRTSTVWCLALAGSLAWAGPAPADDLTGAERLLCVTIEIAACSEESPCEAVSAEELNVPRFLKVDLAQRLLSTTEASGENRQTRIEHLRRVEQQAQQAQQANAEQQEAFKKAFSACLEAKKYVVKF